MKVLVLCVVIQVLPMFTTGVLYGIKETSLTKFSVLTSTGPEPRSAGNNSSIQWGEYCLLLLLDPAHPSRDKRIWFTVLHLQPRWDTEQNTCFFPRLSKMTPNNNCVHKLYIIHTHPWAGNVSKLYKMCIQMGLFANRKNESGKACADKRNFPTDSTTVWDKADCFSLLSEETGVLKRVQSLNHKILEMSSLQNTDMQHLQAAHPTSATSFLFDF